MLGLLAGLRTEGFERSFKMAERSLLSDRILAGVHKSDITPQRLFDLCVSLGMPSQFLQDLKQRAESANAFHFGYEGRSGGGLYKVYLEFASRLVAATEDPVLLHLAYKWDALDASIRTIAQYRCWPQLPEAAVQSRVAALYANDADSVALKGISDLIGLSTARAGTAPMYLEVREEGNPRASCDLNLHHAGIGLAEAGPWLSRLRKHYSIADEAFLPVYEAARQSTLGHVSGGTNRNGEDFVTVYYAAEGI